MKCANKLLCLNHNAEASEELASPTGILATPFGLKGVLFAVHGMRKHMHLPNHLQMRAITPVAFPDFHLRDDGLRMWAVDKEYVRDCARGVPVGRRTCRKIKKLLNKHVFTYSLGY